jgi:CheY-like chemotaxis protein
MTLRQSWRFMMAKERLDGKRILIVDDEPDVLEVLGELLETCDVVKASTFSEAKDLLESQRFDFAILDIMGVDGYELLKIASEKKVLTIMLTAHALSPEDTIKSFKEGAASYVPKEGIANIKTYLNDILEAIEKGKSFWWRWLDRWAFYFDKKFGPTWRDKDKEFWEKFPSI